MTLYTVFIKKKIKFIKKGITFSKKKRKSGNYISITVLTRSSERIFNRSPYTGSISYQDKVPPHHLL